MHPVLVEGFLDELSKIAEENQAPTKLERFTKWNQGLNESVPLNASVLGALGGLSGGIFGHGHRPGLGTALGVVGGTAAGAALGAGGAKFTKWRRERKERYRG